MTASKLEEAQGATDMPDKIIPRGLKSLQAAGVVTDREWWLKVWPRLGGGACLFVAGCCGALARCKYI